MMKPSFSQARVTSLACLFAVTALVSLATAQQPFLDCGNTLATYVDDPTALDYIKQVIDSKQFKFSSECLEILLKKNFSESADFLLEQYYPNTQIDTEVIVKSVADDVQRQQNYVLYRLLKAKHEKRRQFNSQLGEYPPQVTPMVYQAQSPDDVHLLIRLQESFDELDCTVTYEQKVLIAADSVTVTAVCFESESDIKLFKRVVALSQEVVPKSSYFSWEADGKVHVQLRKAMHHPTGLSSSDLARKATQISLMRIEI